MTIFSRKVQFEELEKLRESYRYEIINLKSWFEKEASFGGGLLKNLLPTWEKDYYGSSREFWIFAYLLLVFIQNHGKVESNFCSFGLVLTRAYPQA